MALDLDGDSVVREARIALGGVATVPWRAREAEAALKGKRARRGGARSARPRPPSRGAQTHEHNAFKVTLGKRTLVRALLQAAAMEI